MVGKALISVLLLTVLTAGLLLAVFRGLGATDQKLRDIEADFHGQCVGSFSAHIRKTEQFCACLWEEVRGANRVDMLKRLMALEKGAADERDEFMRRASVDCARRLHIERR